MKILKVDNHTYLYLSNMSKERIIVVAVKKSVEINFDINAHLHLTLFNI